jgi:ParB family transcriptional regulator, chromosome partitioning protein
VVKKHLKNMLAKSSGTKVLNIPLAEIRRNPFQPRREFNDEETKELARSIQLYGVIQPIIVRKHGNGYQLIAGERRYRACQMIGMVTIPAIVQEMSDQRAAAVSLIENLQRKELNYFEEAEAYARLVNDFGMTQEEVAQRIGKSQATVANKLRLLRLPKEVRRFIITDNISERHARALLKLTSPEMQKEVLRLIYEKDLTVKETDELVDKLRENNLPQEPNQSGKGQQVSLVIKDARIFLNTIKETVNRAKSIGLEMTISERETEAEYEIVIRVPKFKNKQRMAAKG